MNNSFLLQNCLVVSPGVFIRCGEILVEDRKIKSIGKCGTLLPDLSETITKYDLGGRMVLPGLVNPHAHLYSSLSAGLSPKGSTKNFSEVLSNFWWPLDAALDEESVYYSAVSGIIDAVKHGVTCIFDHHASMNFVGGSLDIIERAFSLAGLKGVLCFETSDRKSISASREHLAENARFIEKHLNSSSIRGAIGLHANLTLSDSTLDAAAEILAGRLDNYPVHIHCGEDITDLNFCIDAGCQGPVDRLNRFKLLGGKSILAHCIHLSEYDRELLENYKPNIISNPESNANNRVGKLDRSRIPSYLIGTDGMSFDMVSSLRSQYLLGEGLSEDFGSLYDSFIKKPAQLIEDFFPGRCGRLEAGFDADIAVLDYIPETPVNEENIIGHLIFGARGGKAYMTIAGGNILYHDGRITFTFENSIKNQIRTAAEKLHRRYYG